MAGITYSVQDSIPSDIVHYVLFPIAFLLVNYAFVKLLLDIVKYENKLVIILRDKLIMLSSSLLFQEDLEIMDVGKIMKIDVECHGILANVFGFGNLILEQQKDEVRVLHYIPNPYKVFQIFREKTNYINTAPTQDLSFFNV